MKRGVKQKLRGYFVILNILCGCIIFVIYNGNAFPNYFNSSQGSSPKFGEDVHLFDKRHALNLTKILFWTSYYGDYNFEALHIDQETFRNCPVKCQLTFDKKLFGLSDGVIFHARDINRYNSENVIPDYHPPSQVWIFFNQESPKHTYLDLKNFGSVFNWTMTYRQDSDVYHPYGRFIRMEPINKTSTRKYHRSNTVTERELSGNNSTKNSNNLISYNNGNESDDELYIENQIHSKSHPGRQSGSKSYSNSFTSTTSINWNEFTQRLISKPKLVAWVVSHCTTFSNREGFVYELQEYLPIDIYGKCGMLVCPGNSSLECFPFLGKLYKFYLSFENSLCVDYITEKFYDILRYDIVPVVYGGANYSQIAPFGSFINAMDFSSAKELANYLFYLDKHPEEYLKYFSWKKMYRVENGDGWCSLCMKITKLNNLGAGKLKLENSKFYSDIDRWWNYVPIGYPDVNPFSTSTATVKDNFHTSVVSSSLLQSHTKDNQRPSRWLKSLRLGLTDNEPQKQQLMCLNAPSFPTESWLSQVWKYITVK